MTPRNEDFLFAQEAQRRGYIGTNLRQSLVDVHNPLCARRIRKPIVLDTPNGPLYRTGLTEHERSMCVDRRAAC